jgi:hypothetical protein
MLHESHNHCSIVTLAAAVYNGHFDEGLALLTPFLDAAGPSLGTTFVNATLPAFERTMHKATAVTQPNAYITSAYLPPAALTPARFEACVQLFNNRPSHDSFFIL